MRSVNNNVCPQSVASFSTLTVYHTHTTVFKIIIITEMEVTLCRDVHSDGHLHTFGCKQLAIPCPTIYGPYAEGSNRDAAPRA